MSFATLRSGPSALRATWQVAVAASSGSEDADGEELVEPPEPEATEPPSRRAAIRRLDGRRFSGAQAWPAPVAPCAHPFARRPRCWWRVNTQSASPTAHLSARLWTGKRWPDHTLGPHGAAACSRRARVCDAVARRVGVRSGAKAARAAAPPRATRGWIGGCYVHAEGSWATSQGCGEVVDMRGSHKDATLAS